MSGNPFALQNISVLVVSDLAPFLTNQTSLWQKRKFLPILREDVAFSKYISEPWNNMVKILKLGQESSAASSI